MPRNQAARVLVAVAVFQLWPAWASADDLAPDVQAETCRQAVQLALGSSEAARTIAAYRLILDQLEATVDAFVSQHGALSESALHCLDAYGVLLNRLGESARALAVYERAVEIATETLGSDADGTQTLKGSLAVAAYGTGDFDRAVRLGEEVAVHRQPLAGTPKAQRLAITLGNLSLAESGRGNNPRAREVADQALSVIDDLPSLPDSIRAGLFHNYAIVLDRVGERAIAQEYFERALRMRLAEEDQAGAIESLASLAASFNDVGRFDESDRRYREASLLADQILSPLDPVRAKIAASWCRVLGVVGRDADSLTQCNLALALWAARGEQNGAEALRTQVNQGIALGRLGKRPKSLHVLKSASRGLAARLGTSHPDVHEATRALGVILAEAGLLGPAEKLLERSFRELSRMMGGIHPDVVLAEGEYGVVLAMRGELSEAESFLKDYAEKTEKMRLLYGRDERTTAGVFSRFASTRMFLAKLLIGQGRCAEAFDWVETSKARSMLDRIAEHASLVEASDEIRSRANELERERARLSVERARAMGDGAQQSKIDIRLRGVHAEIAALGQRVLAGAAPSASSATPSQRVQRKPPASGAALVSFGLADEEVLAITYRSEWGFRCRSLGNWDALADTVLATRALQSNLGGIPGLMAGSESAPPRRLVKAEPRTFAVQLRSAPIREGTVTVTSAENVLDVVGAELMGWVVESTGGAERLIVSPDGVLHLVALDALSIRGRSLVLDHVITQVPSFMGLLDREENPRGAVSAQGMVVVGDPIYEGSGIASSSADARRAAVTIVQGGTAEVTVGWPPLPAAAQEVSALTKLFGLVEGRTRFTGSAATAAVLRLSSVSEELRRARYVVFSAHAFADLDAPEVSSLVLSLPPGEQLRASYLTAAELATLDLNSDIVFFSACDTGYGRVISGEGVMGLSAGALLAGSRSTVHTLWNVVDEAAAQFTATFFSAVKEGVAPAEALVATKRAFLADPRHRATAIWAPYVLVERPD
jgi:tetratricopeptide (TPR) repeat protein